MKRIFYYIITLFMIVFLTACTSNHLSGTSWVLTEWSVSSVSTDVAKITLKITNSNTLEGNGGINSFSASYNIGKDNKILIGNFQSTEMASADPLINLAESIYFKLLITVRYYELNNDKLILYDANHNEILGFTKAD